MPAVGEIIKRRFSGLENMATVTDTLPSPSVTLDYAATVRNAPFVLTAFLAWASGGTGQADMELVQKIRDEASGFFDKVRRKFDDFGTDSDAFVDWRIKEAEHHHWVLSPGDLWVPTWTNPDSGTMRWAVEFQLRRWEP